MCNFMMNSIDNCIGTFEPREKYELINSNIEYDKHTTGILL